MNSEEIIALCTAVPFGLALLALIVHTFVDGARDALWPRGLRWFPRAWLRSAEALHLGVLRVFWPEQAARFKSYDLLRLEAHDREWRTWAGSSVDRIPEWRPWPSGGGRWAPRTDEARRCPCGYGEECALWCGTGHRDSRCPVHRPGED